MAKISKRSEANRCSICLRTVEEAISDQIGLGIVCDNPQCKFSKEISAEIENRKVSIYCIRCGKKFEIEDKFCTECGNRRI